MNLDEVVARMSQATTGPEGPPGVINQQMQYLQMAGEGLAIRFQSAEAKEETEAGTAPRTRRR